MRFRPDRSKKRSPRQRVIDLLTVIDITGMLFLYGIRSAKASAERRCLRRRLRRCYKLCLFRCDYADTELPIYPNALAVTADRYSNCRFKRYFFGKFFQEVSIRK